MEINEDTVKKLKPMSFNTYYTENQIKEENIIWSIDS